MALLFLAAVPWYNGVSAVLTIGRLSRHPSPRRPARRERCVVPITFQHWPWLLLLPPLAAWLVGVHRRSLAGLDPWRWRVALGVRLAGTMLLILALAGTTLVHWSDAQAVWFLVDHSDSMGPEHRRHALDQVTAAAKKMRPGDQAGVILFGADALIEAPLADALSLNQTASTPVTTYTDLARALRLALAAFPDRYARRIVLLSDGNENLGNALEEVALAAAQGVPVDVVPIEQTRGAEALLERMVLPNEVKIGEPFELRVVASSQTAQEATLRLFRNHAYIGAQQVSLSPGKNVVVFVQNLEKPGFHTYEARLEPRDDTLSENNRALGFSLVRGRPRVLYVEGDPGQEKYLAAALRSQQIDADVVNTTGIPRNLAEFQSYDSIVFSNVSALHVSAEQMKMIQSNVRDLGQGFVMIGGDESFGAGGYYRTPIEELLPVDMDIIKPQEWPSTAVVCVIDKSGSMADGGMGFSKVDLAKEAAIATVEVLDEHDDFGVIAFDQAAKEVVSLQRVRNQKAIQDRIASIVADGGTSLYPALMMAHEWLKKNNARVKHCIVLTDGMSLPGDFKHAVQALNAAGVTLSTVAVGQDADLQLLEGLARGGGGRFYYTDDPWMLPRIFTKEAFLVAKSLIVEEPFVPRVDSSAEVLRGIDWSSRPPLLGYVATSPKALAAVPMRSPRGDPLFAYWRYGLGRTIAFTSDCKARWGAHWLTWPGYQRFWGQAIRWTLRRSARAHFQTHVEVEHGRGRIRVDALDEKGEFANFLEVRANVVRPDMVAQSLVLPQSGPGRYEGEFDATAIGTYMVNITRSDQSGTASQTTGFAISYPPEYQDLKTNHFLLTRLAERTGGRVLSDPADVFTKERRRARVPVEIWPALLLAALLLFPLDVAVRRVQMEPAEIRAWARTRAPWLRSRVARRKPEAVERPETMGRLLERKSRVATAQRKTQVEGEARVVSPRVLSGGAEQETAPPVESEPARSARQTPEPPVPEAEAHVRPTERLLRAKRRARGEDPP